MARITPAIHRLKVKISGVRIGHGKAARDEVGEALIELGKRHPKPTGYTLTWHISGLDAKPQVYTQKRAWGGLGKP